MAPLTKPLFLLPPPKSTRHGGNEYINAQSLLRRLHDLDSGTVTTVTSHLGDDLGEDDGQMTDNGEFDFELEDASGRLLIPADMWLGK